MKSSLWKIAFLLGVLFFSVITFNNDAKAATTTAVKLNVDGKTTSTDAISQNNKVYLPIRSISEKFPTTAVSWNQETQQISLKISYYREASKYIINLQDSDGINYISKINLNKGTVDSRFGSTKPIVINGVTYVALTDISKIYDAKVEWDSNTKTVYVLYKGKGYSSDQHEEGFYNAVGFASVYAGSSKALADQTNLYNFMSYGYEASAGVANMVKLKPLATGLSTIGKIFDFVTYPAQIPFKNEFELLHNYSENNNYLNGVYVERSWTGFYTKVRSQTLKDIK